MIFINIFNLITGAVLSAVPVLFIMFDHVFFDHVRTKVFESRQRYIYMDRIIRVCHVCRNKKIYVVDDHRNHSVYLYCEYCGNHTPPAIWSDTADGHDEAVRQSVVYWNMQ